MLTRMTDEDWTVVLEVFRAACSRCGDKGRDDRQFLEALHYFSVHTITWRALPTEFGHWNSTWEALLAAEPGWRVRGLLRGSRKPQPDRASGADVCFHHRAGARLGRRGQRGQHGQALGRLRGGFLTKTHFDGYPLAFHL